MVRTRGSREKDRISFLCTWDQITIVNTGEDTHFDTVSVGQKDEQDKDKKCVDDMNMNEVQIN